MWDAFTFLLRHSSDSFEGYENSGMIAGRVSKTIIIQQCRVLEIGVHNEAIVAPPPPQKLRCKVWLTNVRIIM